MIRCHLEIYSGSWGCICCDVRVSSWRRQRSPLLLAANKKNMSGKSPEKKARSKKGAKRQAIKTNTYNTYVTRLLKQTCKEKNITRNSQRIMNAMIKDVLDQIGGQAAILVKNSKKSTVTPADVQAAVRILIPGPLGKRAIERGHEAVRTIAQHRSKTNE